MPWTLTFKMLEGGEDSWDTISSQVGQEQSQSNQLVAHSQYGQDWVAPKSEAGQHTDQVHGQCLS